MSVPARAAAADQEPPVPRPGPGAPGWGHVQRLLATAAEAVAVAVADLAARPDCPGVQARLGMLCASLTELGGLAAELGELERGRAYEDALIEAVRKEAYEQGVADCKASRCRLRPVPGPG